MCVQLKRSAQSISRSPAQNDPDQRYKAGVSSLEGEGDWKSLADHHVPLLRTFFLSWVGKPYPSYDSTEALRHARKEKENDQPL